MYRIGREEIEELARVIESRKLFRTGDPKQGHLQEVERFEQEWARTMGSRYALCLSGGGTAALLCGLAGLGIGPGDEVIVPGYTFMATASAVLAAGAIPVLAEVDETLGLDPEDLERKIGPATRAVIPVHMVGLPCNLRRIREIADRRGLKVIEDSCQADGGSFGGRRLGTWGEVGTYSFNYYKVISCGEGGAVVTDDRAVYERMAIFADSGMAFRKYASELSVPIFIGLQLRASELMGAVMRIQLQRLDGILTDLRHRKRLFIESLAGAPGIRFAPVNDAEGDCGVVVAFQFDEEKRARAFAAAEGVGGWLPFDTGKHVYINWDPVLQHRAGHHPAVNPYNRPENRGLRLDYSMDQLPRTLDILKRTVFVSLHPDWSEAETRTRIAACRRAAAAGEK
ncbi:MAG TPA: DegT/DnrJ/EryC1/StrS family aminotransferase [bacterium]|uniref:dTDP-3-amino-3,6-dideoxy-alpha-D-galactopyranose transaminase n=1 Tax=candidate division TA06 bacterium ADurb.Bin417 TaxID=1852828 RepID=A0A1V5MG12_UNCT6|nr:MAG: dTDP-3-amino-3,6-dideoxy-alpha-D-galactopyranose transaminase [candidate division TA06 bacterium ADurb.Bin417]HNS48328.1 DegT/DnrJ/EryC1/StrS family aminotransferase [bacterium]